MEGLNWQTMQLPLAAGLNQKVDERALQPPDLLRAVDVEFDEVGGLQTRKPFESLGADIFGGGTLSNIRRIVENGDELLCFTKDTLYSWSSTLSAWVLKDTHYAVSIEEKSRFVNTGEQVTPDRCEMSGEAVFTWIDGTNVYIASVDTTTGAIICSPTSFGTTYHSPRLIALSSTIMMLAFNTATNRLNARIVTPGQVSAGGPGGWTAVGANPATGAYDACRIPSTDSVIIVQRDGVTVFVLDSTLTTTVTRNVGRASNGSVAVAVTPDGTKAQIIRTPTVNTVVGDLLNVSTLADINISTAIGTTPTNSASSIAIEYLPTAGLGVYYAYVWWSSDEDASPSAVNQWRTSWNTIGTNAATATEAIFAYRYAPRSRAFVRDGLVYVWLGFFQGSNFISGTSQTTAALQNAYFLYNSDAELCAKAVATEAGMQTTNTYGWLPTVQDLGSDRFAFCATERRIVDVTSGRTDYGDRAPREVVFTFDSNEARRCARLGQTLYLAGAEIKQYDRTQLAEVGSHLYPYFASTSTAAGAIPAGVYAYKPTYRWDNALGEVDRSTTALIGTKTLAGPFDIQLIATSPLVATHKTNVAIEWWRTAVNPTDDAPYYLVTGTDPGTTTGNNAFILNTPTSLGTATLEDAYSDSTLTTKQTNPENGSVLENVAPPSANIIAATTDRLFLAGIANRPDEVRYSKLRGDGEVASFHEALSVAIPQRGGDITAIAITRDGTPVVFRETATYVLLGDGFDNAGTGQNYVAREVSSDYGAVSQEAVVVADSGIIFKSSRGWCRMNAAYQIEYIGGPVADYDSEDIVAVHVTQSQQQVRALSSSRCLVFDTLVNQWAEWSVTSAVSACVWSGRHIYVTSSAVKRQRTDYTGIDYGMDVETAWIKLADLQGYGSVRRIDILGEYRSSHTLRIRLARNYATTYFQDKTWTPSPTTVGGPLQVKHSPSIRQCQAIKVRITASAGEALKLTGLGLEVGLKRGLFNRMPAAQRQ